MGDVRRAEERRGAGTSGCIVTSGTAARAIPGQGADVPIIRECRDVTIPGTNVITNNVITTHKISRTINPGREKERGEYKVKSDSYSTATHVSGL